MSEHQAPSSSMHTLCCEYVGERYCAQVQHEMPENVYRFVAIWDVARQQYLPLHEIEGEYVRRIGSLSRFLILSKWAARRRFNQYLDIWAERQGKRLDRGGQKSPKHKQEE